MADWRSIAGHLSRVSTNEFSNVCHLIAESFCQDRAIMSEQLQTEWSLEEWWDIRGSVVDFMKKAVRQDWNRDQIDQELDPLDSSYKNIVSDVVNVHRSALKKKLLQSTAAISHTVLSDFDWKLQLALSSDKMSSLHQPFLSLDLDLRQADGKRKQVALEMDKEELVKLIASLEGCSKSVQQLTIS